MDIMKGIALAGLFMLASLLGCGDITSGPNAGDGGAGDVDGGASCTGCWSGGRCVAGDQVEACGAGGGACSVCPYVCQVGDDLGITWCGNGAHGFVKAPICRSSRCDLEQAVACPAGCNATCSSSSGCSP